jgi:DNA-binding MarR family transcriptional regulator
MTHLSNLTQSSWIKLTRTHHHLLNAVEEALKSEDLPPLGWYDVLLELSRAGNNGLRPFELEQKLLLPQYGISRLVDKIEKSGYLQRQRCPDDKRGLRLFITEQGSKVQQKMWPIYATTLNTNIEQKLDRSEQDILVTILSKLLR